MHSKEDILFRTILIVAVIIGVIILTFVFALIWHQRRFRRATLQKVGLEIDTIENERKKMAVDLHDEIGPMLTLVKFKVEGFGADTDTGETEVAETVHLINDIIIRVRSIFNLMNPANLLNNGIDVALTEFINKVNHSASLHILFESKDIPVLSPARAIHIFRIVQEIIHNTIKHAHADTLRIQIFTESKKLVVLTADNGTGFDYLKELDGKKGLGLQILNSRAALLGGAFHLKSFPGEGTCCHVRIPLFVTDN